MTPIYFIDKDHEINFKRLLLKWSEAKENVEYATACYILALPIIFEKVENYIGKFPSPVSWIYLYEEKYTLSKLEEYQEDEDFTQTDEIPYDLTNSMVQLGKFALNMWNGYPHFNLMDCIASLDNKNYEVVKCAMDMRLMKVEF